MAYPAGPAPTAFSFVLDTGYVLAFDTDQLSPHGSGLAHELRYEKGETVVQVQCLDIRDQVWEIRVNEEISSRAALLAERLST